MLVSSLDILAATWNRLSWSWTQYSANRAAGGDEDTSYYLYHSLPPDTTISTIFHPDAVSFLPLQSLPRVNLVHRSASYRVVVPVVRQRARTCQQPQTLC